MKRNIKLVVFIYVGVAVFTYALAQRVNHLEISGDYQRQNEAIVLRLK